MKLVKVHLLKFKFGQTKYMYLLICQMSYFGTELLMDL